MTRRILMLAAVAAIAVTGCRNSCGEKRSSGTSSCDGPSKYAAVAAPRTTGVACAETVSHVPSYSAPIYASAPIFTAPPPVFAPAGVPAPANELPMPNETIPPTRLPVAGNYAPFPPALTGK